VIFWCRGVKKKNSERRSSNSSGNRVTQSYQFFCVNKLCIFCCIVARLFLAVDAT